MSQPYEEALREAMSSVGEAWESLSSRLAEPSRDAGAVDAAASELCVKLFEAREACDPILFPMKESQP